MTSSLLRTVIGTVSIGAGVVTVGIATSLSPPLMALMLLTAAAQLAYGLAVMLGSRLRGYGIAVELAPSVVFGLILLLGNSDGDLPTAFALGSVLNVLGALLVGAALRASWADREPRRGWVFLIVAALSAGIVGGVATPALAATSAGSHAAAHGGMAGMGMSDMHGH